MVKFTANNNSSVFTKLFLFFVLRGLHLYISFDIIDLLDTRTQKWINKIKTIDISKSMQSIWKYAQKSLTKAQISQSNQANKH